MPLTVTRLDARYHAPERVSVAIPEEVFGIRSWPSGPTWILDPPRSVRERALRHIKESFRDREPALFAAEGRVHVEALRDAHDRAVPGLEAVAGDQGPGPRSVLGRQLWIAQPRSRDRV